MKVLEAYPNLFETGIRNINDIIKGYNKAEIWFHQDLDGVTIAIAMKEYLKSYGLKVVDAHFIQYGDVEYSATKSSDDVLKVMVDFAHGKPMMNIHIDHHQAQSGVEKGTATDFSKTASNLERMSSVIPNTFIFPQEDEKIITMVDSADFTKYNVTPEDVMRSAFQMDDKINVEKNHMAMGLVVNKLLLAYKNKKGFLTQLVLRSSPSLISMYNNIKKLATEYGFDPSKIQKGTENYLKSQSEKKTSAEEKINTLSHELDKHFTGKGDELDVMKLSNGEGVMVNNVVVQWGGGKMWDPEIPYQYDRYAVFKLHPEAEYLVMGWPMGLIQVSKNPFKKGENPHDLGKLLIDDVFGKYKSRLENTYVSLYYIKYVYEQDIEKNTKDKLGFTWDDLTSLYKNNQIIGIDTEKEGKWKEIIKDVSNKKFNDLNDNQKDILKKIKVRAYDLIKENSGGHHNISNLSNLNFVSQRDLGKDLETFMKEIMMDVVKEMKNYKLQ